MIPLTFIYGSARWPRIWGLDVLILLKTALSHTLARKLWKCYLPILQTHFSVKHSQERTYILFFSISDWAKTEREKIEESTTRLKHIVQIIQNVEMSSMRRAGTIVPGSEYFIYVLYALLLTVNAYLLHQSREICPGISFGSIMYRPSSPCQYQSWSTYPTFLQRLELGKDIDNTCVTSKSHRQGSRRWKLQLVRGTLTDVRIKGYMTLSMMFK